VAGSASATGATGPVGPTGATGPAGGGGGILFVKKTTDTSRTSSATFPPTIEDDPELQLTLVAGKKYLIEMNGMIVAASATPDLQYHWGFTGTGAMNSTMLTWYLGTQNEQSSSTIDVDMNVDTALPSSVRKSSIAGDGANKRRIIRMNGFIDVQTGGVLSFRWAQLNLSSSATTVKAATYMAAREI